MGIKMKNDNKININNDNAEYFINKVKHTLTSKYDINKNDLMSIGEFIDFLKCEGIEDVTLKNMRDWDNKGILPAYRVPQGKSREDVRYYTNEHLNIVKEILYLKSIGLEVPYIYKIIFENEDIDIIFLYKSVKNLEDFKKMKDIIKNIDEMEKELIVPIIKNIKNEFIKNNDKIDESYIKKLIFNYKNADLDKEDITMLSFILMLLSAFSSYNEENNSFDKVKFSDFMFDILSKY